MFKRIIDLTGVELGKLMRQRIFYIALFLIILVVVFSIFWEVSWNAPSGKTSSGGGEVENLEETAKPVEASRPDGGFGPLTRACMNGFGLATIFILICASLSISSEMTTGTIRMMLIRPVRRSEFFISKAFALIIVAMMIVLLIELLSFVLVDIVYGFSKVTNPTYGDVPFEQGELALMVRYTIYTFLLVILPFITTIFLGLLISTLVENVGVAIAAAILIYLIMDYFIISIFDNAGTYFFSYYDVFYLDQLSSLAKAYSGDSWAFSVLDQLLGFGTGEIKNSSLYLEKWLPMVAKSALVPIGYIILFSVPSLIVLKKKDILV
ncbi:MAG: ABC transporter permease subunit [Planctomycetes bacterium]|nr:ABC transporter permease subunit [Planctomycetota bacterium]